MTKTSITLVLALFAALPLGGVSRIVHASALPGQEREADRPVFDFHKLIAGTGYAFRLTAFRDGLIVYTGISRVKTLGVRRWQVPPSTVERLVDNFLAIGFAEFKPPLSPGVSPDIRPAVTITFQHERLSKAVTLSSIDSGSYYRYFAALEAVISTRELRCPYVLSPPLPEVELCEKDDRALKKLGLERGKE
jgi:hypothetical protein